jgi:hypothetical protein
MLWYSAKHGRYFDPEPRRCDNCTEIIKDIAVLRLSWSRRRSCNNFYCLECNNANKVAPEHKILTYREQRLVILIAPPKGAIMCPITKPALTNSKQSVFDAADDDGDGSEVIDKTRHAGRSSLVGARIGSNEKVKEIDNNYNHIDQQLETGNISSTLTTLKALPVVEDNTKKLENKNKNEVENERYK